MPLVAPPKTRSIIFASALRSACLAGLSFALSCGGKSSLTTGPTLSDDKSEEQPPAPVVPVYPFNEVVAIESLPAEDCVDGWPACADEPLEPCTLRCFRITPHCRSAVEFFPLVGDYPDVTFNHIDGASRFVYFTESKGANYQESYLFRWDPEEGVQSLTQLFFPEAEDAEWLEFNAAATDKDVLLFRHEGDEGRPSYVWTPGSSPELLEHSGFLISPDGKLVAGWESENEDLVLRKEDGSTQLLGITQLIGPEVKVTRPAWLTNNASIALNMVRPRGNTGASDRGPTLFRSSTGAWHELSVHEPSRNDLSVQPPLDNEAWQILQSHVASTEVQGVSAGGEVVVGVTGSPDLYRRPFRWTPSGGRTDLVVEGLPTDTTYDQIRVTPDGRVMAGIADAPPQGGEKWSRLVRWTEARGMESLLELPGGTMELLYLSLRGDIIYVQSRDELGSDTYRFSLDRGLEVVDYLMDSPGGQARIASDGRLVISYRDGGWKWHSYSDWVDSGDLSPLWADFSLPSGWSGSPERVAEDGRLVIGRGSAPGAYYEYWLIRRVDWCDEVEDTESPEP